MPRGARQARALPTGCVRLRERHLHEVKVAHGVKVRMVKTASNSEAAETYRRLRTGARRFETVLGGCNRSIFRTLFPLCVV